MKSGKDFEVRGKAVSVKSMREWLAICALLGVVFVGSSLLYVWLYNLQVQNGYRLARLYEEQEQLLAVYRKLRLEWCRFEDPFQLEELGRRHYGLAPPRPDQKLLMR